MAAATVGYQGWTKLSDDFRTGYVTGFLAMANLARNLNPGGWIDDRYPFLPAVKPLEWRLVLDEVYQKPENQKYTIASALQIVAHDLEQKYGKAPDPAQRSRERFLQKIQEMKDKKATSGAAAGAEAPPAEDAAAAAKAADKVASAKPPAPIVIPNEKHARKWCRCDGKDPKVARAVRKAAADKDDAKPAAPADKAASPSAAAPSPEARTPADKNAPTPAGK